MLQANRVFEIDPKAYAHVSQCNPQTHLDFEKSSSCCYGWQVWWQRWRLWWRWRRWRWRLWWRWRCYIWFLVCNCFFWICIATLVFDISCPWTLFLFSNIITTNILICLKKSTSFSEICWDSVCLVLQAWAVKWRRWMWMTETLVESWAGEVATSEICRRSWGIAGNLW